MKALVYEKAHSLEDFAMQLADVAEPTLRQADVLVDVRAIGVNPGEALFRRVRSAEPGGRILLGWEFAGVVITVGPQVQGFKNGDRVFGTGDMSRDGAWAERVAVDHRILAKIPDQLSFADAASLPIGTLTAWEAMFRDQDSLPASVDRVLIVGGAGAVGSLATQLLKAKTRAVVISTASRSESREWCLKMGADFVIDHTGNIVEQLKSVNIPDVDMVLSTAGTTDNLGRIAEVLRPFGHICVVDMTPSIDTNMLMMKSASVHLEMIFSKILHGDPRSQGGILEAIAALANDGELKPIPTIRLEGLAPETMRAAHALLETKRTIGKVVIVT